MSKYKLSEMLKRSPEVRPHTVQNEYHPHLPQWNLLEYCQQEGSYLFHLDFVLVTRE